MSKKGTMGLKEILPIAVLFLISILALSIGSNVLENIKDQQCDFGYNVTGNKCLNASGASGSALGDTFPSNITGQGQTGIDEFGSWVPTLALVIAASIIVGMLVMSFRV